MRINRSLLSQERRHFSIVIAGKLRAMKIALLFCLLLLASCTQTSHVPAPWQLPGAAVGTAIDNAMYGSRRNKVKTFIQNNYASLKADVTADQGETLSELFKIANVKSKQTELLKELQNPESAYVVNASLSEEGLEKLTVAVMVHSD